MATQSEELKVVISVVDRLTAELAKLTGTIDKLETHVDRMNGEIEKGAKESTQSIIALNAAVELVQKGFSVLSTLVQLPIQAFASLTSGVFDLVRAYDEQAQAEVRLTSALTVQGAAVAETAASLKAYASEIQRTTRFGDEAVLGVEALFASFIKEEEGIKRATRAAVDFAAAFGEPLESAAQKVLAALDSGSIRIGRFSLELSKATDPAQRLQDVLSGIEGKFGGVADKLAEVGAGPLDQLANVFSDLQEALGELITQTPEFQAFLDTAKQLIEGLSDFTSENRADLISKFGQAFALSFQVAAAAAEALIFAADKLVAAANAVAEVFTETPAEELADDIENLEEKTAHHRSELELYEGVLEGTETGLRSWFVTTEQAKKNVERLTEALKADEEGLASLQAQLNKVETTPIDNLRKSVAELSKELKGLFSQSVDKFEENLQIRQSDTPEARDDAVGEAIRRGAQNAEATIAGSAPDAEAEAAQELKDAAAQHVDAAGKFEETATLIDTVNQTARALDQATADNFLGVTSGLDGTISDFGVVLDFQNTVVGAWGTTVTAQGEAASALSGSGLDLSGSALDLSGAAGALSGAAEGLGSGLGDLGDIANELGQSADALQESAEALQEAANALIQAGGGEPQLASGAIVRRATRALIGEGGPEAVIPLNEEGAAFAERAFGLGGGGFQFNVNAGSLALDRRGMGAVLASVNRNLRDQLGRKKRIRSGSY